MASGSGPSRELLTYSTEITFLEELFAKLAPGGGGAVTTNTLTELSRLLSDFLEVALERGQMERIEKILGFQEILHEAMGASFYDNSDAIQFIPYSRLPPPVEAPPIGIRHVVTDQETLTCPVCWIDFPPFSMVTLHQCGEHSYCHGCMSSHLSSRIVDAEVSRISCPQPSCKANVLECEVRELVTDEVYQKYLHFLVLAVLKEEENARWCTNISCGQPIIWDPQEKVVVCPACHSEFCFTCSRPLHPGFSCEGQQLPDYEEQFRLWLAEKKALVKKCPGCSAQLEKNDGCNHITCRCGAQWCWLCNERMENQPHYSQGPCSGFQFVAFNTVEEATADRDIRQKAEREAAERSAAEERAREETVRLNRELAAIQRQRRIDAGEEVTHDGPSCPHCNRAFPSWTELFSHQGLAQCSRGPATSSRTVFMR